MPNFNHPLTKQILTWSGVVAVLILPWFTLGGAVDMFLKIEGEIKGESLDSKHKDEIDVLAWSWGASQSGSFHTGAGGGAGKASFQDLSITKWVDSASPTLLFYLSTGNSFSKATLVVRKAGKIPLEYIKLEMNKILVTSLSTGGSGGEDRLTENVTFNFASFKFTYTPQNLDGSGGTPITAGWDIELNTPLK